MKLSIKIIMILAGITIFCAIYFTQPAYSNTNINECGLLTPQYMCFDKIIKQNDWIICAELHKSTKTFTSSDDWGKFPEKKTAYDYNGLIKLCGEIP